MTIVRGLGLSGGRRLESGDARHLDRAGGPRRATRRSASLTFLAKALLRLVPVAFGAGVICGAMLLAYACGQAFSGDKGRGIGR